MGRQIEFALRESLARVLTKIAALLPAVLALVLAILVGVAIGALLAFTVRKLLVAMRFDDRLQHGKLAGGMQWISLPCPSIFVSRIVFWGCALVGFAVGVAAFASGYSARPELMTALLLPFFARVVGAAVLLIAGTLAARFLARSVLIGAVNMKLHYARLLAQGVKWLVLVLTIAMMLDHLAIGGRIVEIAFGILFGGIVLTLALSIGLGSRDIVIRTLDQDSEKLAAEESARISHF